jgi:transketolase
MDNKQYRQMANAIRFLSIDAIEKANSGHPGMPMGMADVATMLYSEFLKFDPSNPLWFNRDRFILSAGHGSMLLYSLLYLTGYQDISLEDIKNFRQLHSKTAGHPEHDLLLGVETTTGPLGQGLANAVGIAIAEKIKSQEDPEVDFFTYVVVGDGCLMEGISQEAISLAGHLGLNKLIILFDDNKISIDGPTNLAVSENTLQRFEAANFNVNTIDGHDFDQIRAALFKARRSDKPSFIACRTTIGYGSPNKAGTEHCHGAALGKTEVELVRERLNWAYPEFFVPEEILQKWRSLGKKSYNNKNFDVFKPTWQADLANFKEKFNAFDISTRKASGIFLENIVASVPGLIGGSADLSSSNNTKPSSFYGISKNNFAGRYIHYGVREHAMAAIMNGLALTGWFIPYSGTFLVFSDYARASIRLSALMQLQVLYIMTHDSIGVGEDGPTHQPVEHLASLRAIPNLLVFRPACGIEVTECYEIAFTTKDAPSLFALTRQDIKSFRKPDANNLSALGAYILAEYEQEFKVTIFATGSEVQIAMAVKQELESNNIGTRIISVPCFELFERQSDQYKASLLNNKSLKIAIEAGIKMGWEALIGNEGLFFGMNSFGKSGKINDLYQYFGINKEAIVEKIKYTLKS